MSTLSKPNMMKSMGAVFDPTRSYRYRLWRVWECDRPRLSFIMLNPSTADATQDDPTIRRCLGFATAWGFGALEVVNLFAYRATSPRELRRADDPVGPKNDRHILECVHNVDQIVVAWGNHGNFKRRDRAVIGLIENLNNIYCLKPTKTGQPYHPLYVNRETGLIRYTGVT
jgi:hypothetical protein